jgi:hypothetical protein
MAGQKNQKDHFSAQLIFLPAMRTPAGRQAVELASLPLPQQP